MRYMIDIAREKRENRLVWFCDACESHIQRLCQEVGIRLSDGGVTGGRDATP